MVFCPWSGILAPLGSFRVGLFFWALGANGVFPKLGCTGLFLVDLPVILLLFFASFSSFAEPALVS
ncbi:MAG: hypothetical protein A2557_04515 [Candidatus Lambdaproteobacteria bacterium RIFOXYD2_FULL_56_26]|uniref:Uncharacterized protein n=1 Tax=Candidatus Lambdaproteobacteria bacterium RIFOXYD2_FULL_56_26 TaxID=1817773 RepID=A0A1F6GTR7_9PROT|nr:MAG: hypothetical protein A2557_04515 [Candidatus Lambdaproteobacteria bacterium RIFOXYD2_FULL_56_26]